MALRDVVFDSCLLLHSSMTSGDGRNFYPVAVVYDYNVLGGTTTESLSLQQHQVRNCPSGWDIHPE
jgi:hypothetical protein